MFIFIKKEGGWYALDRSKVTEQVYADCYDRYGQKIGHADAGTVLEIISDTAANLITRYARKNEIADRRFSVGDMISATPELDHYYDFDLFQFAYNLDGVTAYEEMVSAYTYRGWSNSHTLFFSFDNLSGFVEEIEDDDKIIRALRGAIGAHSQWNEKTTYGTAWNGKRFRVSTSNFADAWWEYFIEEL